MKTYFLLLAALFCTGSSPAQSVLRSQWYEIYLLVLAEVVAPQDSPDRAYAIALGKDSRTGSYTDLPADFRQELYRRLRPKGVKPEDFAEPHDVYAKTKRVSDGEEFVGLFDRKSERPAWVYLITGVTWAGDDEIEVHYELFHAGLAAGGGSYLLRKVDGKWDLKRNGSSWVS